MCPKSYLCIRFAITNGLKIKVVPKNHMRAYDHNSQWLSAGFYAFQWVMALTLFSNWNRDCIAVGLPLT